MYGKSTMVDDYQHMGGGTTAVVATSVVAASVVVAPHVVPPVVLAVVLAAVAALPVYQKVVRVAAQWLELGC